MNNYRWSIRLSDEPMGAWDFGYNDPVTAAVGGSIGSALIGSSAASSAADAQAGAARDAAQTQWNMFKTINDQQEPYRQVGYGGLNKLAYLLGINPATYTPSGGSSASKSSASAKTGYTPISDINGPSINSGQYSGPLEAYFDPVGGITYRKPTQATADASAEASGNAGGFTPTSTGNPNDPSFGSLLHTFDANDLKTNLSPSYQFMLDQGLGALNNQASVSGGRISGNALKGINDYAQKYASTGYQQAFDNFNTNQTNIYNRLANIAGLGQTANKTTADAGMATAGNVGSAQLAGGAARAAGYTGMGNAISGAINNASSWYGISNMGKSDLPDTTTSLWSYRMDA